MFERAYSALFGQNLDGTYSMDLLESFEVSPVAATFYQPFFDITPWAW